MYKYHLYQLIYNKDVIRLIVKQFNELDNHLLSNVMENASLPDKLDELCSEHGNLNLLKEIKLIYKYKLLKLASSNGHIETVKYLVSLGASSQALPVHERAEPAEPTSSDYTCHGPADITVDHNYAVGLASENGHIETVKYLVSVGADVTAEDNYAVGLASANGHIETVKYLVSIGADVTADDNYAIRRASSNGHTQVVKYLVSLGTTIVS